MSPKIDTPPKKNNQEKPFPLRMGHLKPHLAAQAMAEERSLHWWIVKILSNHLKVSDSTFKEKKKVL